MYAEPASRAWI
ncbi:hypothetical protein D047_0007, partial [Vibrio parahaemolyticus VPTS-2010_2]